MKPNTDGDPSKLHGWNHRAPKLDRGRCEPPTSSPKRSQIPPSTSSSTRVAEREERRLVWVRRRFLLTMVVLALVCIGHCQSKGLCQGKSEMDVKGRNPSPTTTVTKPAPRRPWRISSTNTKQRVEGVTESRESRQDQRKYKGQWIAKTTKLVGTSHDYHNAHPTPR
ncbi:hypothetical protein U1Q18_015265 [Sarracenia purpurea var. burkii]